MKNIFKMLLVSVVVFMFAACDTDVETEESRQSHRPCAHSRVL